MASEVEIYPCPSSIKERVALDKMSNTVYVDRRYAGDPLLLT